MAGYARRARSATASSNIASAAAASDAVVATSAAPLAQRPNILRAGHLILPRPTEKRRVGLKLSSGAVSDVPDRFDSNEAVKAIRALAG